MAGVAASPMIASLKGEERVNRCHRFRVGGLDAHLASARQLRELIADQRALL